MSNPNDLKFVLNRLSSSSFAGLRAAILRHQQKTGLKINRWQIEEIVDDKGESLRFNFYFEDAVDEHEVAKVQLKMDEVE